MDGTVKHSIKTAMVTVAGFGLVLGATGLDKLAVITCWGMMLYDIALYHNVDIDLDTSKQLAAALLASMATYTMLCTALSIGVGAILVTLTGGLAVLVAAIGLNTVLNILFTYRIGKLYDKLFSKHGNNVANMVIGREIIRSFFNIPSLSELKEVLTIYKEGN